MGATPATSTMAAPHGRGGFRRQRLRPWVLLATLTVTIVAGYVALAGGALWREYDRTVRDAERNAINTARLIAHVIGYAVGNVQRELELTARSLEEYGHLPVMPPLVAVAALTADGTLIEGDRALAALPAAKQATARHAVHPPVRRDGDRWMLVFTHRHAGGTIVAAAPVEMLKGLVEAAGVTGLDSIEVSLTDGTPLLRAAAGTGDATLVRNDRSSWLIAHQTVADTPLAVSVTQPWSAILAEWRSAAVDAAAVSAVVTTVVLVLTIALFMWIRRMQAAEEARRAAEAASRAKSDFLALMSHELRTPLNTVLGFAEMIRDRAWGPDAENRYVEYAGDIHAAGTHLLSVLNDVLDLAKIEAGRMTIHPEPLDGQEVANACYRLSSGQARASGVEIVLAVEEDAAPLYADPRATRQMIVNLLSNACKFTPAGGSVRLEVRDAPGGGTLVTVSDTGVGMTPEGIVKALQRFGQVDNLQTRAQTGTGLGLPLVKGLVELHGGSLTIDSAPGRGTTVTLAFPPPPLIITARSAVRLAHS
ncbi:MAG TPA: HAMP domain-containing sensor histidine kinase [Azospirillum sp.]|nr:HAMP domain-containing sensor histidine kinase [Azospirillum sp.]